MQTRRLTDYRCTDIYTYMHNFYSGIYKFFTTIDIYLNPQ